MADTVNWQGKSGREYTYTVYEKDSTWNDVAGNYIFAGRSNGGWTAQYIGETESFGDRIPNHPEWECATQHGATHVHAHANADGERARKAEEADLIENHRPPCNG